MENFFNESIVARAAGGEALTHKIRFLANEFDVEHARIIGVE